MLLEGLHDNPTLACLNLRYYARATLSTLLQATGSEWPGCVVIEFYKRDKVTKFGSKAEFIPVTISEGTPSKVYHRMAKYTEVAAGDTNDRAWKRQPAHFAPPPRPLELVLYPNF